MTTLIRSSAVVLSLALCGPGASGQPKESPPTRPVVITTGLSHGWELIISVDAKTTTSRVQYHSSAVLSSTRASISVKDCPRMAEAIEAAAKAVQSDKRFENDRVGDVTISIGVADVYVAGKDGKTALEKRKVVMLGGGETGLFTDPLKMNLIPEEAAKFAKSLQAAPGIYERLKSSINFDAIWK